VSGHLQMEVAFDAAVDLGVDAPLVGPVCCVQLPSLVQQIITYSCKAEILHASVCINCCAYLRLITLCICLPQQPTVAAGTHT
jgi:hypothetical protein